MFNVGDSVVVFYNTTVGEVTVTITHSENGFVQGTVEGEPEGWVGSKDLAWKNDAFAEKVASGTIYAAPPEPDPL